jgi:MinD superfamily P-loop ATPase
MKIAVLSGKGGTGKTFVSVNLAEVQGHGTYVDCDVEEPNGHLFFQPVWLETDYISRKLPVIDADKCNGCRICTDFCKFNALAYIANQVLVFEEVCHSCGGCFLFCPQGAISEKDKEVGKVQYGKSLTTTVYTGTMLTKEISGIAVIDALLSKIKDIENVVIDCPPGSACSVMESIKDAHYCVLVAEPTIFGSHNLAMVHELVELYKKPYGVVLNKCIDGENPSKAYCIENGIPVLMEIPYDEKLGRYQSEGRIPAREDEEFRDMFIKLQGIIDQEVDYETAISTKW